MENRRNPVSVTAKLILVGAAIVLALIAQRAVTSAREETRADAEAKASEAKLPADFANCDHPISLGNNVYFISTKPVGSSLARIPGIQSFTIRVLPIGDGPNFSQYKNDAVLSRVVKDRSIARGYFVVLSPQDPAHGP